MQQLIPIAADAAELQSALTEAHLPTEDLTEPGRAFFRFEEDGTPIGYAGYVSVELMNPQIWRIPPLQFGEVGMTALRKLLGQASMG